MPPIPLAGKPLWRPQVWQLYWRISKAGLRAKPSGASKKQRDTAPAKNAGRHAPAFARSLKRSGFIAFGLSFHAYISAIYEKVIPHILPNTGCFLPRTGHRAGRRAGA